MKEISTRASALSTLGPVQRAPKPVAASGPKESFQSSEANPAWMKKPQFQPDNSEKDTVKRGMSTGKTLALVATTLIAGAGAVGLATAHPGPTHAQIQLSQRDANKAEKNFGFLHETVSQQGGSLKSDPSSLLGRVFHQQSPVDAVGATQALAQGYTVYVYPTADSQQGIPINSLEDLKQITNQARAEVSEAHIKEGLNNLKQGLKQVGESISDVFR